MHHLIVCKVEECESGGGLFKDRGQPSHDGLNSILLCSLAILMTRQSVHHSAHNCCEHIDLPLASRGSQLSMPMLSHSLIAAAAPSYPHPALQLSDPRSL